MNRVKFVGKLTSYLGLIVAIGGEHNNMPLIMLFGIAVLAIGAYFHESSEDKQ